MELRQADFEGAVSEVNEFYRTKRDDRRPHEKDWFINGAMIRGIQWVSWNDQLRKLEIKDSPKSRIRLVINRLMPKFKARQAKFLKNRFAPHVVAASHDREDQLDAEATQKALEYSLRKNDMERRYREVLNWANIATRGLVWLHYNPSLLATIKLPDGAGNEVVLPDQPVGDIELEVGSPFELLVDDPMIPRLSSQPRIMRVKLRPVEDVVARYEVDEKQLMTESAQEDVFRYAKQLGDLSNRGGLVGGASSTSAKNDTAKYVLVKELFEAPCEKYPKGRYVVVAGDVLLKDEPQLPYEMADSANPYPVVEFCDQDFAGQFWGATLIQQLVPLQREYNLVRSMLAEHMRHNLHPKVIVPLHSRWPDNAWNQESGEVIRLNWYPGLPEPKIIVPAPISQDTWSIVRLIKDEFDEISNLYPAAQGSAAGTTSGFQVNLLQEATDSIHAPDIRLHELAWEELCYKIRRLMKLYYDGPRIISITGRSMLPEAIEFSAQNIDEHATIIVQTSNALSNSPAVRTQQVIELWGSGLLGEASPENQRKALALIDASGVGEMQEEQRRDRDLARLESNEIRKGTYVGRLIVTPSQWAFPEAMPWDDHEIHWTEHTNVMKTLEFQHWPEEAQAKHIAHTVWHAQFIDPAKAIELAIRVGLDELAAMIQPPPSPQAVAGQQPAGPVTQP